MARVREGKKGVLLVVDVQVGVMHRAWEAPRVIDHIALAVARARNMGVPVLWVQHADDDLPTNSAAWQWVPELVPAAGEPRVHKHFNSAFEGTGLESELDRLGATHITLCGASTNWCIRATAYAALERGYDLTLLHDAHTTSPMALEGGDVLEAAPIVRELNVVMTWLSYPGRTNGIAAAREASFGV